MVNLEEEKQLTDAEPQCEQAASRSNVEGVLETDEKLAAQDIKYDWYQREDDIIVTLFVKVINKENFNICFSDDLMSISLTDDKNVVKNLHLALNDCIKPLECSYKLFVTKVEVKLKKLNNRFWSTLEKKKKENHVKQQVNWDRVANSEIAREETNSDIHKFFQNIYNTGNDEVKKAMIKSFYESCGTVLTTNWSEASSGQVQVQPPEGLEWKKW